MAYKIIDVLQGSPEWLSWKKWKIGGSYASILINENPFCSRLELYNRIVEGKEIEDNENMRRGRENESKAVESFGIDYKPICVESIEHPFLIASLDGWNGEDGVEAKCPRKFSESIPLHYQGQLQHYMYLMDKERWFYIEWVKGETRKQCVSRDDEYIEKLTKAEQEFHNCLMSFTPPEPTDYTNWRFDQ